MTRPPAVFATVPTSRRAVFAVRDLPGGVAEARTFVRFQCRKAGFSDDLSETAILLTSEAVTNALLHAGRRACVGITAGPTGLLVEVEDEAPAPLRVGPQQRPDVHAVGGRGLYLLTELATDWGSYTRGRGKVVWFHLASAGPRVAGGSVT